MRMTRLLMIALFALGHSAASAQAEISVSFDHP